MLNSSFHSSNCKGHTIDQNGYGHLKIHYRTRKTAGLSGDGDPTILGPLPFQHTHRQVQETPLATKQYENIAK